MRLLITLLAALPVCAYGFDRPRTTPEPPPAATVSITASPSQVMPGEPSLVSWTVQNAIRCEAAMGGQPPVSVAPVSDSQSYGFLATATVTMTCWNASGVASEPASVTVVVATSQPDPEPEPQPEPEPTPDPPPPPPPSGSTQYRGIPDPSAALGFDVRAAYAVDQTVTGSRGNATLSGTGTASDPYVIDASGATFSKLTLSGSYVILQGGTVNAPSGSGYWLTSNCNRCVLRDVEVAGPGVDSGHSSAVGLGNLNVWIRGSVHDFGDRRVDAREQDFHGFKVQASDVWILELTSYNLSGDSVQCGDATRGSCSRVYIGGGHMHHNRENAIDIKDSSDVVVSGVRMDGFRPTASSPGEAVIIHDDAVNARVYDNVIADSTMGIVSSGLRGHVIDGNTIQALSVGIQLRNTQNITVTNNDVTAPTRIQVQGGITGTVQQ